MTASLPVPDLRWPSTGPSLSIKGAQQSFTFRLEEAADLANSIATRLADLAVRYPTDDALSELRLIENSLHVISRYYVTNISKATTDSEPEPVPHDPLAGYDHRAGSDEHDIEPTVSVGGKHPNDPEAP
jgi:hypothetical protein